MQDNILNFFRRDNNDYATAWSMLREGRAEEALALAKKLSAQGDGHAYALMGMIYDYGIGGVKIDKSRAASYYQEAIDRCGSIAATRGLAKLLFFGDGLRQDLAESFRVYSALVQHTHWRWHTPRPCERFLVGSSRGLRQPAEFVRNVFLAVSNFCC